MADDKTSKRTSESGSALKEVEHSTFSNKITEDIEIFPQRAVSEAAYFSRDFGESETNDDADNCPNFSIYSATSIDFTKSVLENKSIQKIQSPYRAGGSDEECDENLVQMTDDEDEDAPNENNELSELKLKNNAYPSLNEKVADTYASIDEKAVDAYASSDEKAADAYASSDEKAADAYASLDEKAADAYTTLDEKAAGVHISIDEKAADAYASVDERAADAYVSADEKAADAYAPLDEREENKNIEEIQSPSFTDQEQEYDNGNDDDVTLPEHEVSGEIPQNISDSTDSTIGIKFNNLDSAKPLNAETNTVCPESINERVTSREQEKIHKRQRISLIPNKKVFLELYDDSDWEEWTNEKNDEERCVRKPNALADLEKLTESISDVEDDRGYTPCQDELIKTRSVSDEEHEITGIGGLDTELISEEEGNIFSDDLPKVLPKNKSLTESQIEDGEIIEKHKMMELDKGALDNSIENIVHKEKKSKSKDKDKENRKNKNTSESFKKISSKDRNYRDKDKKRKTRSESREKRKYDYRKKKERTPSRKKEKRKDLEWYDVRNMISEKKKRNDKDEYGRERRPTPSRSRSRARLRSQSRSRSRKLREIRNRSRGRSGYRRFHNSRSKSRSLSPSRSTSVERRRRKRRSRSIRRRSRSLSRTYHRNSKMKHVSKSKTPLRKIKKTKRKRSRSYQRDWTPSWSSHEDSRLSNSPSNNNIGNILASPSWTPPLRENMPNAQNLTVIVSNKDAGKKKKDKRKKTELKMKETAAAEKASKKRRRERSSEPSKEVFASGDNILVSVSFNKNKAVETHPSSQAVNQSAHQVTSTDRSSGSKRSKNKNQEPSEPRKTKTSKVKDKQAKANRNRRLNMLANRKPIAIIDLDKSPFKELTPSPKAVIVLTDSDSEEKEHQSLLSRQERIHQELGSLREESQPESPAPYDNVNPFITNNTGPKTPPEPQVNFSLQLKAAPKLRSVNLLYDHEEDEDENGNDDMDQNRINTVSDNRVEESGTHKGPNTPPEPPNSPPSSPDAYDPFEPTKSPSQSPNIMESTQTTVADKQPATEENNFDKKLDAAPSIISQVPPPLEDKPTETTTNTVEQVLALLAQRFNTTPEKNPGSLIQNDGQIVIGKLSDSENKGQGNVAEPKVPSPEVSKNGVTILSNVLLQPNMLTSVLKSDANLVFTSCAAPVCSTPMMTSMTPSRTNLFNSTSNSTMQNTNSVTPSKSGKSQARPSPIKSNPIKPMVKTAVIKPGIRPHMTNKVHKPSDCDVESPYSPGSDDFDDLFEPPSNDANKISAKNQKTTSKSPVKKAHEFDHLFMSPSYRPSINTKAEKRIYNKKYKKKGNKTQVGVKIDEDQLKVLEELPSSAVEMQVKDKFMKKLNRQERVVEEVKVVLKPHYAKKHVTKEQYKDILRRAVPKICHNRSGEINPQRIHKLIEAYVKKARYSRKA